MLNKTQKEKESMTAATLMQQQQKLLEEVRYFSVF